MPIRMTLPTHFSSEPHARARAFAHVQSLRRHKPPHHKFDYPTELVGTTGDNKVTLYNDPQLGPQGKDLAEKVFAIVPDMSAVDVLELDFSSPLRSLLSKARAYTRSFYRPGIAPGTPRGDGAICQDITRLTFPDESLDLIVSSDVLEHVPDAHAAFREDAQRGMKA